ncbi:unnamed protein product [Parnassius apollo]|uniref:(apollo) hypothetical protein n=1 Tax=Parnassius apollo TaxID=110799 RepID=A0A8S3X988_PARAO|nr:unnamed protein product [Parnassius apollo]
MRSNTFDVTEIERLRREAVPSSDENATAEDAAPQLAEQPGKMDAAVNTPVVVDLNDDGTVTQAIKPYQKRLYKSLERPGVCGVGLGPDQAGTVAFWRGLWSELVSHSEGPWMEVVASHGASVTHMNPVIITPEDLAEAVRRATNWSLGLDGLHQYWLKSSSLESLKKDLADVKLALKELQEKIIGVKSATCDTYSSPISCEDKIPGRWVVKHKSAQKSLLAKISSHASTPAAPPPPEPTARESCSPTTSQGAANNKSVLQSSGTDSKQLSSQPSYAKVADGSDLGPKFAFDCDLLTVSEHNDNVNNSHVLTLKPIKEVNWTTVTSNRQKRLENRKGKVHPICEFNFKAAERTLSLYISRVHRDRTAKDIAGFIKFKTQLETVVTKINTYENSFNAFKITVLTRLIFE